METQQKKENSMAIPPLKEVVELYVKNEIHGIEKKIDENQTENSERFNALDHKVDRNYIETNHRLDLLENKVTETNQRITELRDDLRREIDKIFKLMIVVLVAIATPTIARFIEAALKLLP